MNGSPNDDIYKLIRFLKDSEDVPEHLIAGPQGLLLKRVTRNNNLLNSLETAWYEVRLIIKSVVKILQNSDPESVLKKLKENGLTGIQLEFKLNLFDWLKERWQAERTRNWIVRVLGVMNTILKSLAKVKPELEPVIEFKGAIEQIVRMK